MNMRRLRSLFALALILSPCLIGADEGMWLPHQVKLLDLKERGLKMNPDDLFRADGTGLMSAVVNLGGGTGGFVSSEGLILTNHHVAFGALQRVSTPEKDYIRHGYLAPSHTEEIPAPGAVADVLLGYEDVTDRINGALKPGMDFLERHYAQDRAVKAVVAEREAHAPDLRAVVAPMHSGNIWYVFVYKRLRDIRIVYAPPLDLGNFGGETDNWMWPRHTCDFTFLRAYVSPDGTGADHAADNVPYRPRSVIRISLAGYKEGDLTFILGYPGRTYRNFSLPELRDHFDGLKKRVVLFREIIDFYEQAGRRDREVEIKYAGKLRGLLNSLKNAQGKVEGMEKYRLLEAKAAQEGDFLSWAQSRPDLSRAYGSVPGRMELFMKDYSSLNARREILDRLVSGFTGSTVLAQAYQVVRAVGERQKPDLEREAAYQERNWPALRQSVSLAERGYDLATDRAFLKQQLKSLIKSGPGRRPSALESLPARGSEKEVEDFVDRMFDRTAVADPVKRLELLDKKPEDLRALDDPALDLAAGLEKDLSVLREEGKALGQELMELKRSYEAGLLAKKGGVFAPDANGTLRFTYGEVRGYAPRDAVWYLPRTTLRGVIEKDAGEEPFRVPEKIKVLQAAGDFGPYADPELGDVPACFLNVTNVTGGNSGSPTFNARGEQVGIIFDMTYESVTGDYLVIPELQRSISVDIRYVLFVTEKFSGGTRLLREMGL
ncbi:MAG: S46 family peptidase [Candidatus Aminicenantes bacterium]|nr:S46 family peptidase [Candidatus Aminicenantes bacterium]